MQGIIKSPNVNVQRLVGKLKEKLQSYDTYKTNLFRRKTTLNANLEEIEGNMIEIYNNSIQQSKNNGYIEIKKTHLTKQYLFSYKQINQYIRKTFSPVVLQLWHHLSGVYQLSDIELSETIGFNNLLGNAISFHNIIYDLLMSEGSTNIDSTITTIDNFANNVITQMHIDSDEYKQKMQRFNDITTSYYTSRINYLNLFKNEIRVLNPTLLQTIDANLNNEEIALKSEITDPDLHCQMEGMQLGEGGAANKTYVLGRLRKVYTIKRYKYIKTQGEFMLLSKAKELDKQKNAKTTIRKSPGKDTGPHSGKRQQHPEPSRKKSFSQSSRK